MYLARKYKLGTLFLRVLLETGPPFYVVVRATRRSNRLQGNGSTFISQLAPGIEPATTHSAVKCSTNWANPAALKSFLATL